MKNISSYSLSGYVYFQTINAKKDNRIYYIMKVEVIGCTFKIFLPLDKYNEYKGYEGKLVLVEGKLGADYKGSALLRVEGIKESK